MFPIRRVQNTLFKLAYRYSHARSERHNERLWPHVRVGRDAEQRIDRFSYRGRPFALANTTVAPGSFSGTGHIIACGPSINAIDYDRLALHDVMGVNGAIALADRHPSMAFTHYCFNDTGFVRARPDLVERVVTRDLLLFTTPFCLWYVLQRLPREALRCRFFLIENPQWRAQLPARTMAEVMRDDVHGDLAVFDPARALGFGRDIRHGIFDVGTVAYVALQIMAWLGYSDIVMHGVDLKDAAQKPRFYETQADCLPTTLDEYLPHHIRPSFVQAARLLRERGVRIINLSPDSALTDNEFERRDWRSYAAGPVQETA